MPSGGVRKGAGRKPRPLAEKLAAGNPGHRPLKKLKDGSFGVGLALSRMILSAQNATIRAVNRSEGGACFTIRFYHQIL